MGSEMPALAAVIAITMGLLKVIEMLISKKSSQRILFELRRKKLVTRTT